jgi:hypothetical protein
LRVRWPNCFSPSHRMGEEDAPLSPKDRAALSRSGSRRPGCPNRRPSRAATLRTPIPAPGRASRRGRPRARSAMSFSPIEDSIGNETVIRGAEPRRARLGRSLALPKLSAAFREQLNADPADGRPRRDASQGAGIRMRALATWLGQRSRRPDPASHSGRVLLEPWDSAAQCLLLPGATGLAGILLCRWYGLCRHRRGFNPMSSALPRPDLT